MEPTNLTSCPALVNGLNTYPAMATCSPYGMLPSSDNDNTHHLQPSVSSSCQLRPLQLLQYCPSDLHFQCNVQILHQIQLSVELHNSVLKASQYYRASIISVPSFSPSPVKNEKSIFNVKKKTKQKNYYFKIKGCSKILLQNGRCCRWSLNYSQW